MGAITAALLAVGFTSAELEEFMNADLRHVLVGKHHNVFFLDIRNFYGGRVCTPGNIMCCKNTWYIEDYWLLLPKVIFHTI